MKRVLMLASVASMIDQFNMPNIALLQKLGYEVDVACNFIEGNTCSDERVAELKQKLQDMHVRCYQIDFSAEYQTHGAEHEGTEAGGKFDEAKSVRILPLSQPDWWCGGTDRRAQDKNEGDLYRARISFLSGGSDCELAGVLSGGEDAEPMDGCVDNDQS